MKQRQSASNGFLVLYVAPNDLGKTRLGLIVSRKCGNAVVRNSWKRALREAFRLSYLDLPVGYDLVALPPPRCNSCGCQIKILVCYTSKRVGTKASSWTFTATGLIINELPLAISTGVSELVVDSLSSLLSICN